MVEKSINTLNSLFGQPQQEFTGILRSDLRISFGHSYDSENKFCIIYDTINDKYYRVSNKENLIISYLDKNYELSEFIEKLKILNIEVSEEKLKEILKFLDDNSLLLPQYGKSEAKILKKREIINKAKLHKFLNMYMSFKIPFGNPDEFLNKSNETVFTFLNKWSIAFLLIISSAGYVGVIVNWHSFSNMFMSSLDGAGLAKYILAVIFLKIIHEAGHAYVAKSMGVRVRQFGLSFIFFMPRAFTDLTDAWRIKDNKKRLLIDISGILAEIIIGGFFALVWINTGPGTLQNMAYYIFTMSILNTIVINGNPFIRYDGYYVLMDFLKIDNLQRKSSSVFKGIFRYYCFGLYDKSMFKYTPSKRLFLTLFSISSFIYKIFLYTGIILIVYYKFTKAIGILLVILEVYLLVIKPFYTEFKTIYKQKDQMDSKKTKFTLFFLLVIVLILFLPLPWSISTPYEVKAINHEAIYVHENGFLEKWGVENYDKVSQNEIIANLRNPNLNLDIQQGEVEISLLNTEINQLLTNYDDMGDVDIKLNQLKSKKEDLAEITRKKDLLSIKAPIEGIFVKASLENYDGKWITKGMQIGEVYNPRSIILYCLMNEEDVGKIDIGEKISIYPAKSLEKISGKVVSLNNYPIKYYKDSPLLSSSGGPIEVLPSKRKQQTSYKVLSNPKYLVKVIADEDKKLLVGETGQVFFRKYSSIGTNFIKRVISILTKELSF